MNHGILSFAVICLIALGCFAFATHLFLKIRKTLHQQKLELMEKQMECLMIETNCAIQRKKAGLKELPQQHSQKESTRPTPNQPKRMLSAAIDSAALVAVKAFGSYIATLITEWLKPKT